MSRVSAEAVARDRDKSRERAAAKRAANREAENARINKWRASHRDQVAEQERIRYGTKLTEFITRPFIMWDGEGYDAYRVDSDGTCSVEHRYMLFGCSHLRDTPLVGMDLGTVECLDYILATESRFPDAFHVGFAFDYDVNMILRDVPKRFLRHLAKFNDVHWNGYYINYIPRKWFRVSHKDEDGKMQSATIWDVISFFNCKYTTALEKYKIATKEQLKDVISGKSKRGSFTFAELEYVTNYWQQEVEMGPLLMDKLREMCYDNGMFITKWYGPGALANNIMRRHKVNDWHSKDVPYDAMVAIRTGFAGGRFNPFRFGRYDKPVYTADINSAYVYAYSLMPRLDNGTWRRVRAHEIDRAHIARFGIYHISYHASRNGALSKKDKQRETLTKIHPLFHRNFRGNVYWPPSVDGWFWSPEAAIVADNPDAEFLEAWVYDDDGTYPFEWVHDEFDKRLILQHQGNAAEKTIKWGLAAMYGAMARQVGWDKETRQPPKSHELAWAGFVTSWCRAEMYKLGYELWLRGGLISIDTDGVTSSIPISPEWLPRGIGEKLGQWKLEEFGGIIYWQSGVYWLKDAEGEFSIGKTRGIERGKLPIDAVMEALANSKINSEVQEYPVIRTTKPHFVGFKEAISGRRWEEWRTWKTHTIESVMGGSGSCWHRVEFCERCQSPESDLMHTLTLKAFPSRYNEPFYLPWIDEPQHRLSRYKVDAEQAELERLIIVRDCDIVDQL